MLCGAWQGKEDAGRVWRDMARAMTSAPRKPAVVLLLLLLLLACSRGDDDVLEQARGCPVMAGRALWSPGPVG